MSRLTKIIKKIYASQNEYIQMLREDGVHIGDGCSVDKTAVFGTEPYLIKIGNNVRITHDVKFITHDGGIWVLRNLKKVPKDADLFGSITIGDNVNIGWDSIIMPNVTIGNNVIVACGSVVTKSVPDNSVVAGIPARVIETIDEYCEKNKNRYLQIKNYGVEQKRDYLKKKYGIGE